MNAKLAQMRRLLDDGYELDDIRTEGLQMEATLVRRGQRATVRFDRATAADILFHDAWRSRRRTVHSLLRR